MHNFFFDDLPVTEPYSVYKTPPKKDRSYKFFIITGNYLAPETMWKHNICREKRLLSNRFQKSAKKNGKTTFRATSIFFLNSACWYSQDNVRLRRIFLFYNM